MDLNTGVLYTDDKSEIMRPLKKFVLAFQVSIHNPGRICSGSIRANSGFFPAHYMNFNRVDDQSG